MAVSPLALGTMTFGTARWGSAEDEARAIFRAYVEEGGNFIDTADVYADGESEAMLGRFVREAGLRDELVLATKAGFSAGTGPHGGGTGAKHLRAALEGSLRRLGTEFVDMYWLHAWDGVTPAEELLETMTGFVRSGKIRYWGISNAPAWYVAQTATLAAAQGRPRPIALQYWYSLIDRDVEDEHLPLARATGMGLVPWSPLAFGLLTGKYDRAKVESEASRAGNGEAPATDARRLDGANPFGDSLFTERNWGIVEAVRRVAAEIGQSSARTALAWVVGRPGVASTLIGVSRPEQLSDNVAALGLTLSTDHRAALDAASAPERPRMTTNLASAEMRRDAIFGGASVRGGWR